MISRRYLPALDEKIYGTIHIGFGNNLFMGGAQDSDIHYDCIITKPTVYLDGICIIKNGRHIYFDKPAANEAYNHKQFAPYLDDLGSDREIEALFLEFPRERRERAAKS